MTNVTEYGLRYTTAMYVQLFPSSRPLMPYSCAAASAAARLELPESAGLVCDLSESGLLIVFLGVAGENLTVWGGKRAGFGVAHVNNSTAVASVNNRIILNREKSKHNSTFPVSDPVLTLHSSMHYGVTSFHRMNLSYS